MYKKALCFLPFFFCLIIFSCSEKAKEETKFPDLVKEAVDTLRYSQFVDSIEYISLETTDACLIKNITDIQISTEYIFVFDIRMQTIWIFTKEGKYHSRIFSQGNAPGEYVNMHQFEYDSLNNRIIVSDLWTHTLLFYTVTGEYLKSIKLDIPAFDFKIVPSGGYVVSLAGEDKDNAGVYYLDDSGKIIKQLVTRKQEHMAYFVARWELCSVRNEICFMAPNFDNIVYHFDGHNLEIAQSFKMKPDLKHSYKENVSLEHLEDFIRTEYIESESWIYASYDSDAYDIRRFWFSKKTNQYWIGEYLKNDLDGMQCAGKTSVSDEDTFVFWCTREEEELNPMLQILYLKK